MSPSDGALLRPAGRPPLRVVFRAPVPPAGDGDEADSARPVTAEVHASHLTGAGSPQGLRAVGAHDHERDFRIVVHSNGPEDRMSVVGEIDIATAPRLHVLLQQLLTEGRRHVSVDFGAVTFLDVTALTFLLAAGRDLAAAGGSLTVVGHNPILTRLLTVAGLTGVLDN